MPDHTWSRSPLRCLKLMKVLKGFLTWITSGLIADRSGPILGEFMSWQSPILLHSMRTYHTSSFHWGVTSRDNVNAVCYEIYPESEFPNFHRLGAAAIPGPITLGCTGLSLDYYACCRESLVTVWNFTDDLGVSWNQPDSACTGVCHLLLLSFRDLLIRII